MSSDHRPPGGRRVRSVDERPVSLGAAGPDASAAPPLPVVDERDRHVWLDQYTAADLESLVAMYRRFPPTDRTLGLPPATDAAIRDWLATVADGTSVVARHDGDVVGHAMFVPVEETRYELAIFVARAYRGAGIGSVLVRSGLARVRSAGGCEVFLSVDACNERARDFYEALGFGVDAAADGCVEMSVEFG